MIEKMKSVRAFAYIHPRRREPDAQPTPNRGDERCQS
jgi:hypothetical protein